MSDKIKWQGTLTAIQPRTKVWRYVTDNRTPYYLGYNLFLTGTADNIERDFTVAISDTQQSKLKFRIGDTIKGTAWPKKYEKREFADFYRAGSLKLLERKIEHPSPDGPPWAIVPPPMSVYEERGARMLATTRWSKKCKTCIWANKANVEIMWCFDRDIKKYRFETFCFGPKSCKHYDMGKPRSVPYRNRGVFYDDGCLDVIYTEGRDD